MLDDDVFRDRPTLEGAAIRLEPLTEIVFDSYWAALQDPEVTRLTGSHETFDEAQVGRWLRTRREQRDRIDWAIMRSQDGAFLGEVVINDLDAANESAGFRIWLAGPDVFGHGYGTEATRLVVDFAFNNVGLHRLGLEVFDHNRRARRVYEKCGFVVEGRLRDALLWHGRRHDTLIMAVLSTDLRAFARREAGA